MDNTLFHGSPGVTAEAFDDLDNLQVIPGQEARASTASCMNGIAKGFEDDVTIGGKAIGGNQERLHTTECLANLSKQTSHQGCVAAFGNLTPNPQTSSNAQRSRHPDFALLGLDTQFVGLNLTAIDLTSTDHLLLDPLPLHAGSL